jgi:hypothetical protein
MPALCSNAGSCDYLTGQCTCFEGFEGNACQRRKSHFAVGLPVVDLSLSLSLSLSLCVCFCLLSFKWLVQRTVLVMALVDPCVIWRSITVQPTTRWLVRTQAGKEFRTGIGTKGYFGFDCSKSEFIGLSAFMMRFH